MLSFFSPAPRPANERDRQEAVDRSGIRTAGVMPALSAIVVQSARLFAAQMAAVSIIDRDRQWFAASIGLHVPETSRATSFCAHAILQPDRPFVVRDTLLDDRFAGNPLVISDPSLRFYAGVPIRLADGQPIGALCVLDRESRSGDLPLEELSALAKRASAVITNIAFTKSEQKSG